MRARTLLACLLLSGCASTPVLKQATAKEIGVPADEIRIIEKVKIVYDVKWKAIHGEQRFRCESVCADTRCRELDEIETICEDLTFEEIE